MCLEDLRLGKGRQMTAPFLLGGAQTLAPVLPADPRRVLVLVTFSGQLNGNNIASDVSPDFCKVFLEDVSQTVPVAILDSYNGKLVMRIEDYGILVTSKVLVTQTDTTALGVTCVCTGVISYAVADPIPGV